MELGRALGLSEAQLDDLAGDGWRISPLFSDRQRAVIRWAEAVTLMTAHDDDEGFAAIKSMFNDRQILELTFVTGMWNLSNRVAEALHLVVEPVGHRIEFHQGGRR